MDGRCVNRKNEEGKLKRERAVYKFLDNFEESNKIVDRCIRAPDSNKCRCSATPKSSTSLPGEGCSGDASGGAGWCFLENVSDPSNPTFDCFDDAQYDSR